MSNSSKIAIGVVVVIILGLIVWWYAGSNGSQPAPVAPVAQTQADQVASASAAAAAVPVAGLSTSAKDTSDAALDKDLSSVNTQINGLSADNASVDATTK